MSTAYWNQWDKEELDAMQGKEPITVTYQDDDHDDGRDDRYHNEEAHCCNGCMDCLGLSWRDFM